VSSSCPGRFVLLPKSVELPPLRRNVSCYRRGRYPGRVAKWENVHAADGQGPRDFRDSTVVVGMGETDPQVACSSTACALRNCWAGRLGQTMRTLPLDQSVAMIPDGASVMIGGFMAVGTPERVIDEIVRQNKRDLTAKAPTTTAPRPRVGRKDSRASRRAMVLRGRKSRLSSAELHRRRARPHSKPSASEFSPRHGRPLR